MAQPFEENRELARQIVKAFGGEPSVREYFDDERSATIDILTCTDALQKGVNAYATLALSDAEIFDAEGNKLPFGIEIIAACEGGAAAFVNAISTCAFNILKDKMPIYPGAVFPRVLELYRGLSETLSHALFVDPFLWDDRFVSRKTESKTVAFLQMVPISDDELDYLRANGASALEEEFERKQIDVFDINRKSVFA